MVLPGHHSSTELQEGRGFVHFLQYCILWAHNSARHLLAAQDIHEQKMNE